MVEWDYVDREYLDDYASYYSRCFTQYGPRCRRLHFFKSFEADRFLEAMRKGDSSVHGQILQNDYLGYIVVRPLPQAVIGRTTLAINHDAITKESEKDLFGRRVIRCHERRTANLFGFALAVEGIPFQEQDKSIGACATSALWSALQYTAHIFDHGRPSRYQISALATKYVQQGRSFPQSGLTIHQICQAIKEIGLEPDSMLYPSSFPDENNGNDRTRWKKWCKQAEPTFPLLSHCYSYLRNGLPIILGIYIREENGLHAVTAVGYEVGGKIRNDKYFPSEIPHLRGNRLNRLFVHDDQYGPYLPIDIIRKRDSNLFFLRTRWNAKGEQFSIVPIYSVVPVSPLIRVTYLKILRDLYDMERIIWACGLLGKKRCEWDFHITTVNKFRTELLRDPELKGNRLPLLTCNSPKYFWRAQLLVDGAKYMDLLFDATDMEPSCQIFKAIYYSSNFKSDFIESIEDPEIIAELASENPQPVILNEVLKKRLHDGPTCA